MRYLVFKEHIFELIYLVVPFCKLVHRRNSLMASPALTPPSTPGGQSVSHAPRRIHIIARYNNDELAFKMKPTTRLKRLMEAFCDRQKEKHVSMFRFLFNDLPVLPEDTPEDVSVSFPYGY
jgi:hypothetical protein